MIMLVTNAVHDFLMNSFAVKNRKTYDWEKKTFQSFLTFSIKQNIRKLEHLNRNVLYDYLGSERDRGLQNVTLNKKLSLVQRLLEFHRIQTDISQIRRLREKKRTVDKLSDEELSILFEYLNDLDINVGNNLVYKTLYYFILDSGCRIDETLHIKKENISLTHRTTLLEKTKFDKQRFIDYSSFVSDMLNELYEKHDGELLFWNLRLNRPLDYNSDIQYFYRKMRKETGMKKLTSHRLRHTFASLSIQNGMNILSLKELLGHVSLRTTQRYLHADRKKTKSDYDKYSPFGDNSNSRIEFDRMITES